MATQHLSWYLQTRADSDELDQYLKREVEKFSRTLRLTETLHSGEVSDVNDIDVNDENVSMDCNDDDNDVEIWKIQKVQILHE